MEHKLLRTIKALASLLMIFTMISIIILDTLLPDHSEPHSFHGNRILERDFTADAEGLLEVSTLSSNNRLHADVEISTLSTVDQDSVQHAEVGDEGGPTLIVPFEKSRTTPSVPTIKSSKSSVLHASSSYGSESESSSGDNDGFSPYVPAQIDHRYHITRYRRSNPDIAAVTHYESIFDPMLKSFVTTTRQFPYITCQGSGLIIEQTRAPTVPTNTPTRAPVAQVIVPTHAPVVAPTQAPVVPVVMMPTEELVSLKSTRFELGNLKRMVYQGSISDIRMYGKPRRIVHAPGAFGGLPVIHREFSRPPVGARATRSPTIEPTHAPTPWPTPRVFHKVCRDGRVVEIDGTHTPTVLPSMAPTYAPVSMETRPPAFVGYVWGNGYGMENNDDTPRWSFTKNEGGKILFDHPNIEKAIYRGSFAQVRRQFKRRVDTLSPW